MENSISKSRSRRTRQIERESQSRRREKRSLPATALLVAVASWVSAFIMLFGLKQEPHADLMLNQRSPFTVVAMTDFSSVDIDRTELARKQAAMDALPIFSVDTTELTRFNRTLNTLYDRIARLHEEEMGRPEGADEEGLSGLSGRELDTLNLPLTLDEAMQLFPPERGKEILDTILRIVKQVWQEGIVSPVDKRTEFSGYASRGRVDIERESRPPRAVAVEEIRVPTEAVREVEQRLRAEWPSDYNAFHVLNRILRVWMQPNLLYNTAATNARKAEVESKVDPVVRLVREGETLIHSGERATPQIIEQLAAHKRVLSALESPYSRWITLAGGGAMLLAGIVICGGLLQIVRPQVLRDRSTLLLLLTVAFVVTLGVRLLIQVAVDTPLIPMALVDALFPLALAAILIGILVDGPTTIVLGVWISMVSATLSSNNFPVLVIGLSVSVIVAMVSRQVVRRAQVLKAGVRAGIVMAFLLAAMGLLRQYPLATVAVYGLMGLLNGMICGLLALLTLPLMEMLFNRTTDIRLLELSDLGHPLLQRMAVEAPGSYQHSIMVANLAQAAANRIGANALMIRVCAYFHDIGKLSKPGFFTENIQQSDNPHDELSPSMSTLVITSHVKEGVTLAQRYKLPRPIIDAIQQHHGTGLVSYFYHRARKQAQTALSAGDTSAGTEITAEESFRYGGPKPQSKEMAILALADSVEAASRSIDKPTPSRIKNLVTEIINGKWQDGQLNKSPLTFAELSEIQDAFVFTLTNMLHGRIPYPKNDENRDQQPAAGTARQPEGVKNPDSPAHTAH